MLVILATGNLGVKIIGEAILPQICIFSATLDCLYQLVVAASSSAIS
jgi:hypothetical protein